MAAESRMIENAVQSVLKQGLRTRDIHQEGKSQVGTTGMGEGVVMHLRSLLRS
jgi:3-isopropylmalate dehydrogenase